MGSKKQLGLWLRVLVSVALIIQLSGCGTILYPERRGQRGGSIDPGVAILDGLGLLLFIIPGVIAFAVDFITGAIYLPGGRRSSPSPGPERVTVIRVKPGELNERTIAEIIKKETGCSTGLILRDAEIRVLKEHESIGAKLAEIRQSGFRWKD